MLDVENRILNLSVNNHFYSKQYWINSTNPYGYKTFQGPKLKAEVDFMRKDISQESYK